MRLQDREGYMLIDQRDAPRLPDDVLRSCGLGDIDMRAKVVELPTFWCPHCTAHVVQNPKRNTVSMPRHFCRKCGRLICDGCHAIMVMTGVHKTFAELADDALEAAAKSVDPPASPIFLPT